MACWVRMVTHCDRFPPQLLAVVKLGLTVVAAFAVCWAPYLGSKEAVLQVRARARVPRPADPGSRQSRAIRLTGNDITYSM